MKIVVTGATSFIGALAVRELLHRGHQVYAVVRPGSANTGRLPVGKEGLALIEMALEELDGIGDRITDTCDGFLHFGWDGSGSHNRMNRAVQQKNVEDSLKALSGAKSLGCRRFVFSGSQAEYGIHREAMTETTPCTPVSEYGKAKVDFYQQASAWCQKWREEKDGSLEYVHTRIFSVYGPGDHPWSLVESCLDAFMEDRELQLGECTQMWNFLYVEDLVDALLELLFYPGELEGAFNIAGGEKDTRPLREYVEEIHRLCDGKGSCCYGTRAPNAEGPANLIPDISKLMTVTGWYPKVSFEEGVKRMQKIRKNTCVICGHKLPNRPLMEFEDMPSSAQNIPSEEQLSEDRGISLSLYQCSHCGLVQFDCEPVDYYRDVIRSGGFSTTMVELRTYQYKKLIEAYHLEGKCFLEAGCGRGEFLKVLERFPVNAYGIEHRADLVKIAVEDGLFVWQGFTECQDEILENRERGIKPPYDVFLSFNFLEHQPDPGAMLRCLYHNLAEDGMGLITVPSLEYILEYDGYYELIRDHLVYYTFDTLRYVLETNGFRVLEEEMVNRDTLSVVVKRIPDMKFGEDLKVQRQPEPVDISGLQKSRISISMEMNRLVDGLRQENKSLAIWGASHQGFTLAATTRLGDKVTYIIDSAPFKQGRYAPASHIPIISPDEATARPVDAILIVAPGYTAEIAGIIRERFPAGVQILTLRSNHIEEL